MKILMHLHKEPFEKVKNGVKKVECRILDGKRKKLSKGNEIIFENRETTEKISVIITDLKRFNSFSEMYNGVKEFQEKYKKEKFLENFKQYYSVEEETKYGVVAIFFKLK